MIEDDQTIQHRMMEQYRVENEARYQRELATAQMQAGLINLGGVSASPIGFVALLAFAFLGLLSIFR
jgi:hypothetical protein